MKYFINIKFEFEGFHKYILAPKEVSFLRTIHRHIFVVKARIEVFTEERELEFFMVQRKLNEFIQNKYPEKLVGSCENIAKDVYDFIKENYCNHMQRLVQVVVYEDNENGGEVSDICQVF